MRLCAPNLSCTAREQQCDTSRARAGYDGSAAVGHRAVPFGQDAEETTRPPRVTVFVPLLAPLSEGLHAPVGIDFFKISTFDFSA